VVKWVVVKRNLLNTSISITNRNQCIWNHTDVSGTKPSPATINLFTNDHRDIQMPQHLLVKYIGFLRRIAILFIPVASISYLSGEYYVPELQRAAMKKASFDRVIKIPIMFGWQIIFSTF
jgi:hypothetical protein